MSQTALSGIEQKPNSSLTKRIVNFWVNWSAALTGLGLFITFVLLFVSVQFTSPNLLGTDGYFHIRFAQIMRQQGLLPAFPWLPLTILHQDVYFDHHFLYHVFLIPFTFGDLREGAKWVGVLFPSLAFVIGWIVLRGQGVRHSALWALGFFAVSQAFLYRLSMTRVQAMSLLMLLLMLHVTLTQRCRWLLPLTVIYIWMYDAFMLPLIVVGAYVAARWLFDQHSNLKPLTYTVVGLGLGTVINPYFPYNAIFIYHHVLPKLIDTTAINVGNEWFPYETWSLVENATLALAAFIGGTFALGIHHRRMDSRTATLFFISIVFGLLLFKSRRFVEYYPAFALLFCAFAWTPLFEEWRNRSVWLTRGLPLGLLLIVIVGIGFNIRALRNDFIESTSHQKYANASTWLKENTPAGSRVFQTDWDDFSRLYYYNTHNTYTIGLDPTYMQSYDADLYSLWRDISKGRVEPLSSAIIDNFETEYVFTDLDHVRFLYVAAVDPRMKEVYRDDEAAIFQIISE